MPIITMLVSIRPSGWDGHSPSASRASITWPTISAGSRLRTRRIVPVWQKVQLSVQPTWLDTHSVPRSASGMNTISIILPVGGAQQPFARAVGRHLRLDHLGPRDRRSAPRATGLRLGDVGHRREFGDAAIVDPVPELLGAQLGLLGLEPGSSSAARIASLVSPTRSMRPSARGGAPRVTGTGSMGPGMGMRRCRRSWRSRPLGDAARFCQRSPRPPRRSPSPRRRACNGR